MNIVLIELSVIAVVYVLFSVFLQRKLIDTRKQRKLQRDMQTKMDEYRSLTKNNAEKAKLDEKQKEISTLMSQNMRSTLKPALVILPFFIILYYVLLPNLFPITNTLTILTFKLSYREYFIIVAILLGVVSSLIITVYDKRKVKEEALSTLQLDESKY